MPTRIEDLLDLDSLLTPEDIELRQTVRRFGEQRLRPHVADWFEAGEVPVRELAADLGKLGVLGMHLKGYGCGGSTATAYGLVCQELEAIDSGLRSLVRLVGLGQHPGERLIREILERRDGGVVTLDDRGHAAGPDGRRGPLEAGQRRWQR